MILLIAWGSIKLFVSLLIFHILVLLPLTCLSLLRFLTLRMFFLLFPLSIIYLSSFLCLLIKKILTLSKTMSVMFRLTTRLTFTQLTYFFLYSLEVSSFSEWSNYSWLIFKKFSWMLWDIHVLSCLSLFFYHKSLPWSNENFWHASRKDTISFLWLIR